MARPRGTLERWKKNPDRWRIRATVGTDPRTGRRVRLTRIIEAPHTAAGRKVVQNELAALVAQAAATDPAGDTAKPGTIKEIAELWLARNKSRWAPNTYRHHEGMLGHAMDDIGDLDPAELTPLNVEALLAKLAADGRSPRALKGIHTSLRAMYNQAVRWGVVDRNPVSFVDSPVYRPEPFDPPEPEKVAAAIEKLEALDPCLALFIRVAAHTGSRRGELCALRWSDIDLEVGSISITRALTRDHDGRIIEKDTKTHRDHTVAIGPGTTQALALWKDHRSAQVAAVDEGGSLAESSFVFVRNPDDTHGVIPPRPDSFTGAWMRRRGDIGMPSVPLKNMRHFVATQMIAAGHDPVTVAHRLGHASPNITLRVYARFLPARDSAAATDLEAIHDVAERVEGGGDVAVS